MVVRNLEAQEQDALETYINKTFDITKFLGKNDPPAYLCLKTVACALGDNDLLTNVAGNVIEGFTKSSTSSFNEFCASQIALHYGSFYCTLMKNNHIQTQLNDVLNDLETAFFDLVGGKL
jgi:hypothetical protein